MQPPRRAPGAGARPAAPAGAATIAPVTYVQMLVATTLGYVMFGDVPDLATFAGAGIIIGAGLLLWSRTAARAPSREPSGLTGPK